MITLIDDPRHRLAEDGTARLSFEQAQAILDLRLARLTALGREEIGGKNSTSSRWKSPIISRSSLARPVQASSRTELPM